MVQLSYEYTTTGSLSTYFIINRAKLFDYQFLSATSIINQDFTGVGVGRPNLHRFDQPGASWPGCLKGLGSRIQYMPCAFPSI